jgi:hypothetical protein
MRALVAALVAVAIVVFTAAPHVHGDAASGDQGCQVCVMRHAGAVAAEGVTLAPPVALAEAPVLAPVTVPAVGAPQGAVPGQSPPAAA